jgi:hypothetical protein
MTVCMNQDLHPMMDCLTIDKKLAVILQTYTKGTLLGFAHCSDVDFMKKF